MSRNVLKIIACLSMLIDHIGFFLFPEFHIFRYFGRIALPIFAFFIAEGCRYTQSKKKYILNVFALAVICQPFYIVEEILSGALSVMYLNILFTLFMAQVLCCLFMRIKDSFRAENRKSCVEYFAAFTAAFIAFAIICCKGSSFSVPVKVDYGIAGVILPLFAATYTDRKKQMLSFSCGLIIFNFFICPEFPYTWFSLLALPLLYSYNGKNGVFINKWIFYAFYPLHIGLIYGIKMITA